MGRFPHISHPIPCNVAEYAILKFDVISPLNESVWVGGPTTKLGRVEPEAVVVVYLSATHMTEKKKKKVGQVEGRRVFSGRWVVSHIPLYVAVHGGRQQQDTQRKCVPGHDVKTAALLGLSPSQRSFFYALRRVL